MTTEQLYYQSLAQLSRLGTGVGQKIEPDIWVALWNAAQASWFGKSLESRSDSVLRDQLSYLYVPDELLTPVQGETPDRFRSFNLPDTLYQLTSIRVRAIRDSCEAELLATPQMPQLVAEQWEDPMLRPDFDWRETIYSQARGKLLVYQRNFQVNQARISYYQRPIDLELPGYQKLDGSISQAINSDMPAELQQEILQLLLPQLQA
ncbi:hypothetical protein CLV58_109164 [Spirosoma oryzae]|uniref:Uncharacterized protein n=1 Tax=Spirosoma oryzae TaxID=1469603 RepID=A0A2T0SYF2_9BACT|nr:hypothetical protein [Spirosoma oryzae]PRY38437.1 hypothetical protein CLV58_109164 [Spirosoma oryzae]